MALNSKWWPLVNPEVLVVELALGCSAWLLSHQLGSQFVSTPGSLLPAGLGSGEHIFPQAPVNMKIGLYITWQ